MCQEYLPCLSNGFVSPLLRTLTPFLGDFLSSQAPEEGNVPVFWNIPWTQEPGRLQSMGSQRVRPDWVTIHLLSSRATFVPGPFPSKFPVGLHHRLLISPGAPEVLSRWFPRWNLTANPNSPSENQVLFDFLRISFLRTNWQTKTVPEAYTTHCNVNRYCLECCYWGVLV